MKFNEFNNIEVPEEVDVFIKNGVKIGDGAVVGLEAVVTKDVPANMIAAGVPAKVIRKVKKDAEKGEI